jgi:hypothetical protein
VAKRQGVGRRGIGNDMLVTNGVISTTERHMQTEKVHLTKEKETLLATLYARALESRSPNPILHDEMAEEAPDEVYAALYWFFSA